MIRSLTIAAALVAAAPAAAGELDGTWVITALTRDGKADDSMTGAVRTHAGEKYTVTPKGGKPVAGTYAVSGREIDMKPTGGRYKGQTLKGIYKLEGDTLTVAFAADPEKGRPADFAGGPGVVVAVHSRSK